MPAEIQQAFPFSSDRDDRSEQENDSAVADLYETRVEPLARRFLASKLRASLRTADESRHNQDALELLSEVKLLVLPKLRQMCESGEDQVRDLESYVRTVAGNAFNQYLRRKYPRRLSLKNQFRYLLTHHENFSLWKNNKGAWVCGLRGQDDEPVRIALSDAQRSAIETRVDDARRAGAGRDVIEVANTIFEYHAQPIYFDELVAAACEILELKEPVEVAEPENIGELRSSAGHPDALSHIEEKEFVTRLWREIGHLPLRHRAALVLNFKDDTGDSLIMLLPVMRVASITQIAEALGFAVEDFAKLWNDLPWDDNRIAEHLGLTRQQVINLRQSARQTLKRKLSERS